MSTEILRDSLQRAYDLLRQTSTAISAGTSDMVPGIRLDQTLRALKIAERLSAAIPEIQSVLDAPEPVQASALKPILFDVDLGVIARSSDWAIDQQGHLFGLTAGDNSYEFTGIVLSSDVLAAWQRSRIDPDMAVATRGKVETAEEALQIARKNEQTLRHELNMWKHGPKQAGLSTQATQIDDFLQSVPLIPEVEPSEAAPIENGPWHYGHSPDRAGSKHFIESDDFIHDARLYIDGDFASEDLRRAYGELLASKLNEAFHSIPRVRRPLYDEVMEALPSPGKDRMEPAPALTVCLNDLKLLMRRRLSATPGPRAKRDNMNAMRYVHDVLSSILGDRPKAAQMEIKKLPLEVQQ